MLVIRFLMTVFILFVRLALRFDDDGLPCVIFTLPLKTESSCMWLFNDYGIL